ncbi:hypothetical protein [Streptomyces sp. NPDC045714]|uniref:hypothetical protein n=1 Tax=Streptomyces sp. NPDC045714 TaxID=3154913 RepID=UPI0033F8D0C5
MRTIAHIVTCLAAAALLTAGATGTAAADVDWSTESTFVENGGSNGQLPGQGPVGYRGSFETSASIGSDS